MTKGRIPCSTLVRDFLLTVGAPPTHNRVLMALSLFAQPDGTQIRPGADHLYKLTGIKSQGGKQAKSIRFWIEWGVLHEVTPPRPKHAAEYRIDMKKIARFLDKDSCPPPYTSPPSKVQPNSCTPVSPSAESPLVSFSDSTRVPSESNSCTQPVPLVYTGGHTKERLSKEKHSKEEAAKETAPSKPAAAAAADGSHSPLRGKKENPRLNQMDLNDAFLLLPKQKSPFGSRAFQRVYLQSLDAAGWKQDDKAAFDPYTCNHGILRFRRESEKATERGDTKQAEELDKMWMKMLVDAMEVTINACEDEDIIVPGPFYPEKHTLERMAGLEQSRPKPPWARTVDDNRQHAREVDEFFDNLRKEQTKPAPQTILHPPEVFPPLTEEEKEKVAKLKAEWLAKHGPEVERINARRRRPWNPAAVTTQDHVDRMRRNAQVLGLDGVPVEEHTPLDKDEQERAAKTGVA
jgi:hypothetical protein